MQVVFCCVKQAGSTDPRSNLKEHMRREMYKDVLKCSLCKGSLPLLFTISDTNNARSKNVWRLSPVISYSVAANMITLTGKQMNAMSCTCIWQLISQDQIASSNYSLYFLTAASRSE